jgi:hypothetical protein
MCKCKEICGKCNKLTNSETRSLLDIDGPCKHHEHSLCVHSLCLFHIQKITSNNDERERIVHRIHACACVHVMYEVDDLLYTSSLLGDGGSGKDSLKSQCGKEEEC